MANISKIAGPLSTCSGKVQLAPPPLKSRKRAASSTDETPDMKKPKATSTDDDIGQSKGGRSGRKGGGKATKGKGVSTRRVFIL